MTHMIQKAIQIITDFLKKKKKMGAEDGGITSFIC